MNLKNSKTILGLDVGTNSIGWCVVEETPSDEMYRLLGAGVRIFEAGIEGVGTNKEKSRNEERRTARQRRRQLGRRVQRRDLLAGILQRHGLLPPNTADSPTALNDTVARLDRQYLDEYATAGGGRARLAHILPYWLRARALDEELPLHALGRVVIHLAKRRGFLSNRKATTRRDDSDENEDEGIVRARIHELQCAIEQTNARTVGEYLARLDPNETRIRGRYLSRAMIEAEFDAIWRKQSEFHTDLLTIQLREAVRRAIFHQRPLKSVTALVGTCELEPGCRRAPWALLAAQEFRLLQRVNDLRIIGADGHECPLNPQQRQAVIEMLQSNATVTFSQIRRRLRLARTDAINLEAGGDKHLIGNRTAKAIVDIIGVERWNGFDAVQRDSLVSDLVRIEQPIGMQRRAQRHWGFEADAAERLANLRLEPGYCALSRQAIEKLLPLMRKGQSFREAERNVYGQHQPMPAEDMLPPVAIAMPALRNPVVSRALTELRKVVNAVIRQFGKPDRIRIELARDVKKSAKQRAEIIRVNRERERERSNAATRITQELEIAHPSRAAIEKVRLADECGWTCPYSGQGFGMADILGATPSVQVEHIVPRSRCFDDSFQNKTLCCIGMNQRKGNRTPHEAFGGTADWDAMVARVKAFKNPGKLARFVAEKIADDFAARQLVDTSYASRLAGQYLARLYGLSQPTACDADGVQRIQFGNGRITGLLRQQWGLNSILAAPTAERDSPEVKERFDHRHHAIDAVVVAMTLPRIVQQLAQAAERAERQGRRGFVDFSPPWPTFRGDIGNAIKNIIVSHRVARRVNGQFHKETRYGTPDAECLPVHHRVRHRVPLVKLSSERVGKIVDPVVRQRVEDRLRELGETNPGRAFQSEANFPFLCARNGRQIPIRSVRIEENLTVRAVGEGHRRRLVQLADNHHIEIFAVPNRRGQITWEGRIVSLIDARQRLLRGQPIIDREPRDFGPQATFLFSLSKGESVLVADADFPDPLTAAPVSNGESPPPTAVWVVTSISDGQLEFERHHDGTPAKLRRLSQANAARAEALTDEQRAVVALRQSRGIGQRIYKSPSALRGVSARKITITPLGQIRWAND